MKTAKWITHFIRLGAAMLAFHGLFEIQMYNAAVKEVVLLQREIIELKSQEIQDVRELELDSLQQRLLYVEQNDLKDRSFERGLLLVLAAACLICLLHEINRAKVQRRIVQELDPWLSSRGFIKMPGFVYHLEDNDDTTLVLMLHFPSFSSRYQIVTQVEYLDGRKPLRGPHSATTKRSYTYGSKRYEFCFYEDEAEAHSICCENIKEWIADVVLPWFTTGPTAPWVIVVAKV